MTRFSSRIGGQFPMFLDKSRCLCCTRPSHQRQPAFLPCCNSCSRSVAVYIQRCIYIYIYGLYIYYRDTYSITICYMYYWDFRYLLLFLSIGNPPTSQKHRWAMESQIWSSLNLRTQIPLVIQVFEANLSPPLSVSEIAAQNHRTRQDIPQPSWR